ncbi:hypothetical protein [Salinibacterium sp. UTAS2018]|nr:hypothetical protein [Salinibacterium sp. UTAS2018]
MTVDPAAIQLPPCQSIMITHPEPTASTNPQQREPSSNAAQVLA